jgi:hypothetical protein
VSWRAPFSHLFKEEWKLTSPPLGSLGLRPCTLATSQSLSLLSALLPRDALPLRPILLLLSTLTNSPPAIDYKVIRRALEQLGVLIEIGAVSKEGMEALDRLFGVVERGLEFRTLRCALSHLGYVLRALGKFLRRTGKRRRPFFASSLGNTTCWSIERSFCVPFLVILLTRYRTYALSIPHCAGNTSFTISTPLPPPCFACRSTITLSGLNSCTNTVRSGSTLRTRSWMSGGRQPRRFGLEMGRGMGRGRCVFFLRVPSVALLTFS